MYLKSTVACLPKLLVERFFFPLAMQLQYNIFYFAELFLYSSFFVLPVYLLSGDAVGQIGSRGTTDEVGGMDLSGGTFENCPLRRVCQIRFKRLVNYEADVLASK